MNTEAGLVPHCNPMPSHLIARLQSPPMNRGETLTPKVGISIVILNLLQDTSMKPPHGIALIIFDPRHPSQKSHLFWLREAFSLNWKRPFFSQDSNHGQQINPTSSLSSTLLAPCRAWAELSLGTLSYTKEPTPQIQNRLELPGEIAVLVWIGTKLQPNLYFVH